MFILIYCLGSKLIANENSNGGCSTEKVLTLETFSGLYRFFCFAIIYCVLSAVIRLHTQFNSISIGVTENFFSTINVKI